MQKQKSWLLCNFFAITDSFPSPQSGNGSFLQQISCIFGSQSAIGGHATIPNRKKVAIWAVILFWVSGAGSEQRGSGTRGIDCRTGKKAAPWGGPDGRHGRFRAVLGVGLVALLIDETRYCMPHSSHLPHCCSMPAHHHHPQFRSILLWRGLPSWQNWSTLKKPVAQGVSLKELARVSALGD